MNKKLNVLLILILALTIVSCGGSSEEEVQDTVAPIINLIGGDISLTVGETFVDPGSSVSDNLDTGLTASVSGNVDTSQVGSYVLTYSATDSAGNSVTALRTVMVEPPPDTEAPVITLIGESLINLTVGDTYEEQGATVTDNVDSNLTVTISGSVDTNTEGSYTVTYSASDAANNQSSTDRSILVEEDTTPESRPTAFIFHSENNDTFSMEFWGDTWGTDTVYTDQTSDISYAKILDVSKSEAWGTVIAWGNEPQNSIDVSTYTHARFKVKTDTFTSVQVSSQSTSLPESSIVYNFSSGTDLGNGWVEMEVSLPGFNDMTWFALNFIGDAGTTVLLADVYFTVLDAEPVIGPPIAAPVPPDYADQEVIVLYSDSLEQDSFIGVWNANWWNAPIYSEGDFDGNHFAKYQITAGGVGGGVTGLEFGYENGPLDGSAKTTWNFDLYIESGINKVEVQLVSADGGAKHTIENPQTDTWINYELMFNELIDNDGNGSGVLNSSLLESIGIQLWGPEGKSVYVDNIYFSGQTIFYNLTVSVTDDNDMPLADSLVSVGNISATTDAGGSATLNLPEGEHKIVVNSSGYGLAQANKVVAGANAALSISLVPLNNGPDIPAPVPTATNEEAFVLYSDVLNVDKPISYWSDNWWNAPTFSEVTLDGEKMARFQIIPDGVSGGVTGIQYGVQGGVVNVSNATGLRFNMYATSGISQAVYQIVSSSGPGISTMLPVVTEQWITVELPFSALVDPTGNFNPARLSQLGLQLWGTTSDAVYLDNIYFY